MENVFYIDGEFKKESESVLPVTDLIILRGFGVFDSLITYGRRPFMLEAHIARLFKSAFAIGLTINHTEEEISSAVTETLAKNAHHRESNIAILYTGGSGSDWITPDGRGRLLVLVTPRKEPPKYWYSEGIKAITFNFGRTIPSAKSTDYLAAVFALKVAREKGAEEVLFVDNEKRLLEGSTSNFFFFRNGRLITSADNIIPGITRGIVLELAGGHFPVEIRDVFISEIEAMDEIFLSASNREIVPVSVIDGKPVGNGRPGEKTLILMKLFHDYTENYARGLSDG